MEARQGTASGESTSEMYVNASEKLVILCEMIDETAFEKC